MIWADRISSPGEEILRISTCRQIVCLIVVLRRISSKAYPSRTHTLLSGPAERTSQPVVQNIITLSPREEFHEISPLLLCLREIKNVAVVGGLLFGFVVQNYTQGIAFANAHTGYRQIRCRRNFMAHHHRLH